MKKSVLMMMVLAVLSTNMATAGYVGEHMGMSTSISEGHVGNGGGGVKRRGLLLTFESAGAQLPLMPIETIPGMPILENAFRQMPFARSTLGQLASAAHPGLKRRYFRVTDESAVGKDTILATYRSLMKLEKADDEPVVYAITDGQETYLFEEFFSLQSSIQQAAILFHETSWAINPKLKYQDVLEAEFLFEDYLKKSTSSFGFEPMLFHSLNRILQNSTIALSSAAVQDYRDGILKSFLNKQNRLSLGLLIGDGSTAQSNGYVEVRDRYGNFVSRELYTRSFYLANVSDAQGYVELLIAHYPRSALFKEFLNALPYLNEYFTYELNAPAKAYTANDFSFGPWLYENPTSPNAFPCYFNNTGKVAFEIKFKAPGER